MAKKSKLPNVLLKHYDVAEYVLLKKTSTLSASIVLNLLLVLFKSDYQLVETPGMFKRLSIYQYIYLCIYEFMYVCIYLSIYISTVV